MTAKKTLKRGRPRDPSVDKRIHEAAIELYATVGWAGFNIQQVSQMAGVGKGSIYLRWGSREELLLDSLKSEIRFIDDPNAGSLEENLRGLATQIAHVYSGFRGRAYLRVILEGDTIPGLDAYTQFLQDQMRLARVLIRRDLPRGGLPVGVATILSALGGTLLVHVLTAPADVLESEESLARTIDEVVRLISNGVRADLALEETSG